MPDPSLPPAGQDPHKDPMELVDEYKRAPVRVGCFGCMFSGWSLVGLIVAVLLLMVYLFRRFA